jgi:hypothetical protein
MSKTPAEPNRQLSLTLDIDAAYSNKATSPGAPPLRRVVRFPLQSTTTSFQQRVIDELAATLVVKEATAKSE